MVVVPLIGAAMTTVVLCIYVSACFRRQFLSLHCGPSGPPLFLLTGLSPFLPAGLFVHLSVCLAAPTLLPPCHTQSPTTPPPPHPTPRWCSSTRMPHHASRVPLRMRTCHNQCNVPYFLLRFLLSTSLNSCKRKVQCTHERIISTCTMSCLIMYAMLSITHPHSSLSYFEYVRTTSTRLGSESTSSLQLS